jgi:nucleoid DNA-binding protein
MDKPRKLSHKDFIIRKLAVKLMIPESEVEQVISHNYQYMNNAVHNVCEMELSGFGRLYFNISKAKRDLIRIEGNEKLLPLKQELLKKLRQYENLRSTRGLEEPSLTQGGIEKPDRAGILTEDGDMQGVSSPLQKS